jgi:integrase
MPDEVAALVPLEDRERDRRVFPGLTDALVRKDLYRACRDAGVAAYSPHDLRHRRISLWVAQGFDAVTVKTSTAERFPGVVSVWSEPTEVTRNRAA